MSVRATAWILKYIQDDRDWVQLHLHPNGNFVYLNEMPKKAQPTPNVVIRDAYKDVLSELDGYLELRQLYATHPYDTVRGLDAERAQLVVDRARRFAELVVGSPAVSEYERLQLVGQTAVLSELYNLPDQTAAAS